MTDKEFDFDSLEVEFPFTYKGVEYQLRSASGSAAREFNNARINRISFNNGKASGIKNLGDLPPLLVHLCSFDASSGKQVPMGVVDTWPAKMVEKLYQKALDISGLRDEVSKVQYEVQEAFSRDDSPISLQNVREWVNSLPSDKFKTLQDTFDLTEEEKSKNEQSSTTDGSL